MRRLPRSKTLLGLCLILVVGLSSLSAGRSTQAGGWVTAELDAPQIVAPAGQSLRLSFMVYGHGLKERPITFDDIEVGALRSAESPDPSALQRPEDLDLDVRIRAFAEGPKGHHVVEMTFAEPGYWQWLVMPDSYGAFLLPPVLVLSPSEYATIPALLTLGAESREPASSAGETIAVDILDFAFETSSLEVAVGTTVTFTNTSTIVHNVAFDDPLLGHSPMLQPGESFSVTFTAPGTYPFHCVPHPTMQGEIVVTG